MHRLPGLLMQEVTDEGRVTTTHHDVVRTSVVEEHDGAKFILVYDGPLMFMTRYKMTEYNRRALNEWDAIVCGYAKAKP